MPTDPTNMIIVGKFGAPHGVRGWLKVYSFTEPLENILDYHPWQTETDQGWQSVKVLETKPLGLAWVVRLQGCEDREQAKLYTNRRIGVDRDQLPALPEGEYYWADLIGLEVFNTKGILLGKISRFIETGSNDVMVVSGDKEHWIPYLIGNVIKNIDVATSKIEVDWDEEF